MTILLTGGGSGGHITPLLAVADELKKLDPGLKLYYVGQTGDKFADLPKNHESIDGVFMVSAGKFRRYHGETWRLVFDFKTMWLNFRDFFRFVKGVRQSKKLLKRLEPAAVFIKGGFVGVPVGIAAKRLKVPYITHDSDAIPGLANRIIAKQAAAHAVALPAEVYNYPKNKTFYVGVPVSSAYKKVSLRDCLEYRKGLGIPNDAKVVCVTGGGLGADRLNRAVVDVSRELFNQYPNLFLIHIAGRNHDAVIKDLYNKQLSPADKKRLMVKGFVSDLYRYSAAADVIVTRAGATTLAEFSVQHRACVVVPNPVLTGGHQVKNAKVLADKDAVSLVTEEEIKRDSGPLLSAVRQLLDFSDQRRKLGENFGSLAKTDASKKLAKLIYQIAKKG